MMRKAGDILREARTKKNLTISDVFEGTRIRPSYIESLENSNYSVFHSSTTVKGFIRNYSLFLGLNPENVIAIYRREQDSKVETNIKKIKFKLPNFQLSPSIFAIGGAIFVVASIIVFFTYQYIQVSRPPLLDIIQPADSTNTIQDKITIEVATEKGTDLQINNKQISTINDNGNYFTIVDLVDGQNQIVVTVTNGFKKQTTKEIKVFKVKPNDVVVNQDLNIMLRSQSTSSFDIKYSIDNKDLIQRKMNPGDSISVTAKTNFIINGPANVNNLVELVINQTVVSLLQNTPKQKIEYIDNKIKITALP